MPSGAPWRVASAGAQHPLQAQLSGMSSGAFDGEDEEELSLLPPAGSSRSKTVHKHSLSGQLDHQWHAFQVAMFKPPDAALLENGGGGEAEGAGGGNSSRSSSQTVEPFLAAAVKDLQPSKKTAEWLMVGLTLLPKISWGWLPFCFTFLGFSAALKLLLFVTLFSVYSAAILYRLYLHSDKQDTMSLADIGEAAFGRRLGRRPVLFFCRTINLAMPCILHVAGTRFLQTWLFYTTGVCLPWISLIFGAVVLGLVQIQRLGGHPAMIRVVQPVLTGLAVGATLLKLLLMRATQQQQNQGVLPAAAGGAGGGAGPDATSLPYASDYVIAVVQLVAANYMGQHYFLEEMSGMQSPSTFQHSTAWAQVITLLANLAVAAATIRVQSLLHVRGFISFAFGPDLLSRFVNFSMWLLMTSKYVFVLHLSTKALLPRLPHLLVSWFEDPDGVDSNLHIKPRQLWLICSSVVVGISYLIAGTFPHTFLYLSGLLVSLCYIPIAYTLPCLFSLKLLGSRLSALEYTLSTWVVPVSVLLSATGCWACLYHLVAKWHSVDHGGSWGCNLLQH